VIEVHGIPVANRHRALDDASVLHEFYKKALDEHGLQLYAAVDKIMVRTSKFA
jgi:DNA polymerase III epsilon subunit-like protein